MTDQNPLFEVLGRLFDDGTVAPPGTTTVEEAELQLKLNKALDDLAVMRIQFDLLKDPEMVLANMLKGTIAKLSVRSFVKTHGEVLNGDEAQLLEIANLREELNAAQATSLHQNVLLQLLERQEQDLHNELEAAVTQEKELVKVAFLLFSDICKALDIDPDKLEDPHELLPAVVQLKANHADMVARNALLRERPDLPVDRIPAFERLISLQAENQALRADLTRQAAVNQSMVAAIADIAEPLGIADEEFKNGGPDLLLNAINKLIEKAG